MGARAERAACAAAVVTLLALVALPPAARAQQWLGLEAILDGELWHTEGRSTLLTRDEKLAFVARGYLFAAVELHRALHILVGAEIEAATDQDDAEVELDHLTLRFAPGPVALDLGKFATPVGTFAARRFSTTNPLIGRPDGYPVAYPWGAMLSAGGGLARWDARVAVVSLPVTNESYLPDAGHALRPAVGAGVSPLIGLRLGASYTAGPYLSRDVSGALPAGTRWQDFGQRVAAADVRFARGYFELFAELGVSRYEVPTFADDFEGTTYYVEAKYTWSPRFFTAFRVERNLYVFTQVTGGGAWIARETNFVNGEVGAGVRIRPNLLLKASYRRDDWDIAPAQQAFLGEGHAVAVQLSYHWER
jgi:hypothetical protein